MGYIVDLSKWNNQINWPIAAPQIELAICRVQYGSNLVDHLYNDHVTNLERYGIPHGAYAYGCFVSVADAIVEAKDFMNRVSPNAKFLALDVETDTVKSMDSKGNLGDLAAASQAFIDTCKAAGWKVGFYVSHELYTKYNLQSVQADFIWLPRYGTNDGRPQKKPSYPCDIWQYTDNGYIDGIGKVDINLLQGDKTLDWYLNRGDSVVDDGRRAIKTGGLGYDAIKEVSEVLCSKGIKGAILFEGEAPYVLTEKLANPKMDNFTAWLDERNWYYEYLQ
ncbi:N-acetylmuramoyl-L-alanine amidase [Bacillus cytotoxicus]|uniref:GH25 family lysozyme n=2 Tax=Bacillus cytotoxicus TaxID=580165 RepID=UPI001AEEAF46|nr:GH25 family lysozyme [Bacillus cytotoxicus]QTR83139.1 N-acetylmuramoyl-L-alanine amidase [Bacillus cytotoxicus]QTR86875.1 N-acetylmuramoyl-L-alanine amidase [Bacillus cytotoxicus]